MEFLDAMEFLRFTSPKPQKNKKRLNVDLEADQVRGVLRVIQNLNKHDTIMRIHHYVMWFDFWIQTFCVVAPSYCNRKSSQEEILHALKVGCQNSQQNTRQTVQTCKCKVTCNVLNLLSMCPWREYCVSWCFVTSICWLWTSQDYGRHTFRVRALSWATRKHRTRLKTSSNCSAMQYINEQNIIKGTRSANATYK